MPPKATGKGKAPARIPARAPAPAPAPAHPPQENPLFLSSTLDDLSSSSSSDELDEPSRANITTPDLTSTLHPEDSGLPINVSDDDSSPVSSGDDSGLQGADLDDNDGDPVVSSYDIHITASQAPDLYIFQYPVRSKNKPYTKAENACPLEARLKPKSGLVEVDVPMNVHVNYDEEKGKIWGDVLRKAAKEAGKALGGAAGAGVGNKRRKVTREEDTDEEDEEVDLITMSFEDAVKAGRVLNRQTLGSKIQPDNTKYMVGIFKDDRLHLTPISSTLQLRPQFHHVDTALEAERAATRALRDAGAPQKPQEARAVHLSVKNADDPSSQLSSTMKALRVAEEEEWTKLHWVDQDTDDAWDIYEGSCLKEGEGGVLKSVTGKKEYMEWLATGKPLIKKEGV